MNVYQVIEQTMDPNAGIGQARLLFDRCRNPEQVIQTRFLQRHERPERVIMNHQEVLDMSTAAVSWRLRRYGTLRGLGAAVVWWFGERIEIGDLWCAGLQFYDCAGRYPSVLLVPCGWDGAETLHVKGYWDDRFTVGVGEMESLANDVMVML
ncbi:MAG: hypothetical protein HPY85_06740 [Anaerolineae bacterium]|nr:hypothetical protein [Anaerolineae bacterium]